MRGITFEVEQGELFGLLGPNGAGKTTTIKMLITLLLPTSGEARVLGLDVVREMRRGAQADRLRLRRRPRALRAALGLRQPPLLRRALRRHRPRDQRARIDEVLELVGLKGRERRARRGVLARHAPAPPHRARDASTTREIVFLDEPTIGVDPVGARELRSTIAGPVAAGKTVLLTTHYMFEADALCDRVAVIAKGRLVAQGTPRGAEEPRRRPHGARGRGLRRRRRDASRGLRAGRRRHLGLDRGPRPGAGADDPVAARARADPDASREFLDGSQIGRIAAREPTLEDAYVALVTERRVRATRASSGSA